MHSTTAARTTASELLRTMSGALLHMSLGDLHAAAELATRLPAARRALMEAKIALASGDHHAAQDHLQSVPAGDLTPRRALVHQLLLTAVAISRGDPTTASILAGAVEAARHGDFLNTVVTTVPQVTSHLVEHAAQIDPDAFIAQLIAAALETRAMHSDGHPPRSALAEPPTAAERRILKLLPTSSYLQMAATLYISRNTVKTHRRSIYQTLGVASRSEAIKRAVELRLL